MSNLPNPQEFAKQAGQAASAINSALKATNPSSRTIKERTTPSGGQSPRPKKPNRTSKDNRANEQKLKARLARAEEAEAQRKEYTPTIGIDGDSLTLDYTGKVAGKSVIRRDPVAVAKEFGKLRPILQPVCSVANGVLKGARFTAPIRFRDEKLKAYFKATPLDKASYAYETLLANPKFVQKLSELNEVIAEIFESKGLAPQEVYAVSHDKDTGEKSYMSKSAIDELMEEFSVESSTPTPDNKQDRGWGD